MMKVNLKSLSPKEIAKRVLGITDRDLNLIKRLEDPVKRKRFSLNVLGLEEQDIEPAKEIKEEGGFMSAAFKAVGISSMKEFHEFKVWKAMNKLAKIESLIPKVDSIRDFFNLTYTHYMRYKKKYKSAWKRQDKKEHLLEIKHIIEGALVKDELTLDMCREIAMRAFMAYGVSRDTGKVVQLPRRQVALAA